MNNRGAWECTDIMYAIIEYPNCPIIKYELTDSLGTIPTVPTGIQPDSSSSSAEITLEAGETDYKVYASDQLTPATMTFYLMTTLTGGMKYNFGPYNIDLLCGQTTGGVLTTK